MKNVNQQRILRLLWLAIAAIAFQATALFGGVNQWTTHGPPDGINANSLAVDPVDPLTIYAASGSGIFKSVDGGVSWQALAPGSVSFTNLTCLAVDPTQPTTVYAGKGSGEFLRSHDGGVQWENRVIDLGAQPISMAVDAGTGAIYVGTQFDFVDRSTDGGTTWEGASPGLGGYAVLADSLNKTVLVGTDFSSGSGFYQYAFGGNVARTHDGGANWSVGPDDLGSPVVALAKDPQGSAYYAGTELGELFRSVDGGANWAELATLPGVVSALAVDPSAPSVLYAATRSGRGLLRSTDGGASWRSFNTGMSTRDVRALAIDPTGQILHVGTDQGVFDLDVTPQPAPVPCAPGPDHLCFFGSRFRVDLTAIDPFSKTAFAANAVPDNSLSGYFSFPSLTGDPTFPEVVVKMVDATSLPGGGYWVFYGGMTSVLYTLTITDTTTGVAREYSGEDSCGGADVLGFLPSASSDDREAKSTLGDAAPRQASDPNLELLSGRFQITLHARNNVTHAVAPGLAIPQADRFGSFSLPAFTGDPELPEVFVKMLDAGGGSFLFFHTGLTGLDYAVTVLDTVTKIQQTFLRENADPARPCGGAEILVFPR